MPDYGRIARMAVPLAIGAAALAVAGPIATRAIAGEPETAPGPAPAPGPSPLPDGPASAGAALVDGAPTTRSVPDAPAARRTYQNPVFAEDAPDPAILRADDGMF